VRDWPLPASLVRGPLGGVWPGRTVTWALAGYLLAVALGVGLIARAAADPATGIAFGLVFLLAAGVVVVTFWRFSERVHGQQEQYRRELFDAEIGALARLREASQLREDLIASVSHEFRTPLTAIRGSAATLLARADKVRPEDRATLLRGVVEHSDRLSRLLEDMLLAAAASSSAVADAGAVADVSSAVSRLALGQARPPVVFEVAPRLAAYVDAAALDQVVRALGDHARAEARRDRPVRVRAWRAAGEVLIEVGYVPGRREDPRRLFEPFGSAEGARTGRPASLALYVVRRLVEAHGGRTAAIRDGDRIRVRASLRALRPHESAPSTAPPTDRTGHSETDAEPEPARAASG
jgi:signal transduction histidine kinase